MPEVGFSWLVAPGADPKVSVRHCTDCVAEPLDARAAPEDQFRSIQDPASRAEIARVMGSAPAPSTAIAMIAAMITPALFILGSASLVATVLVRMARVVDRVRALAVVASEGGWERIGATPGTLRLWLDRHASRARLRRPGRSRPSGGSG